MWTGVPARTPISIASRIASRTECDSFRMCVK